MNTQVLWYFLFLLTNIYLFGSQFVYLFLSLRRYLGPTGKQGPRGPQGKRGTQYSVTFNIY